MAKLEIKPTYCTKYILSSFLYNHTFILTWKAGFKFGIIRNLRVPHQKNMENQPLICLLFFAPLSQLTTHSWDSCTNMCRQPSHPSLHSQCMKVKSESEVTQLCPTLSDPMNCSLPGSSIHGIFQARVLEWVAVPLLLWSHFIYNYLMGKVINFRLLLFSH